MKRPSRPRKTANLSESVHRRLNLYAPAASAGGVSALALSQQAKARIIYTPVHRVIRKNSYFGIDLNHDGIVDFTIFKSARTFGSFRRNSIMDKAATAGSSQCASCQAPIQADRYCDRLWLRNHTGQNECRRAD